MPKSNEIRQHRRKSAPKKQESFLSELFSLMAKQCIFSAMIFAALYYLKNTSFPFSQPVCGFIKNIVLNPVSFDSVKEFFSFI